jgi:hypothetical protein
MVMAVVVEEVKAVVADLLKPLVELISARLLMR